jgi:ribosome recycling factor
VQPWDKSLVKVIEKAILNSDLGLNPASSGDVLRIPLPPLTEERRRDLIKVVKHEGENARVAIRNVRRDANQHLKNLVKDKKISEDEERRAEEKIQQLTDTNTKRVDEVLAVKEKDLLEI